MAHWVRFTGAGGAGFGTLVPGSDPVEGAGAIAVHEGDMYSGCALVPGDVVSCGTSLGAAPMRDGATVEIVIDAVGTLRNTFAG